MPPTKTPTKTTTKASKKKASSKAPAPKGAKKAPAKKAATSAAKPAAKPIAKKAAAKPAAKSLAKKVAKPAAKPARAASAPAKSPVKKAAAKAPAKKAPATKPATKPATNQAAKPVTKPVKASIAEGAAPLVPLVPSEPHPESRESRPESRESRPAPKGPSRGALRYVADAESDQTRGSVDEFDALEVIESDDDDDAQDEPNAQANAQSNAMSDRDTLAAGPEGDEPLLTTEERAARKIEHTPETTRAFAIEVARALADDKCTELAVLDVRNLSSLSDYIVVGSGTSDRQMHFAIKNVVEMASKQGHQVARTSSDERKTWLIADFVDVIVHLFEPNTRAHYDIEMLWGDAPRLEWERPDQVSRDRAGLGSN